MTETDCIASGRYSHPVLGGIHVRAHAQSRSIKARWNGQEVLITVPVNCPFREFKGFIDDAAVQKKLLAMRPAPAFFVGMILDTPLVDFSIVYADDLPAGRDGAFDINTTNPVRGKLANYTFRVNRRLENEDHTSAPIQQFFNDNIFLLATHATNKFLIPRGKELAAGIHALVMGWTVRRIKRALGKCSSKGIIALSPLLIFLPSDLVDFVIYHELAHLSEMNHSQAFHEICNRYCGGREAEYESRLRAFRFPVV